VAERGASEQHGVGALAGERGDLPEALARRRRLTRAQERVAAREQERARRVAGLERVREVPGRLLVGEHRQRPLARTSQIRTRARVPGLGEVVGDLFQMALLAVGGERLAGGPVQAGAPQGVELGDHRLPHQRVGELDARPQQAGRQQLLERLLRSGHDAVEQVRVHALAEDRGDAEQLVGRGAQAREPRPDGVAHALRHAGRVLGHPAQDLADEERVALGAGVHRRCDLRGGVRAEPGGGELGDLRKVEPAQADALGRAVAAQLGQRGGERGTSAHLGVAVGADREERRRSAGAQEKRQQQQRRAVGPVQIIEHEHQRAADGECAERVVDGGEEAVPRAGVGALGGAGGARQAPELRGGRAGQRTRPRLADLSQDLRERLVGRERVLRAAAQQHGGVRCGGEAQRQRCLADARLPCHQDQPPRAARHHLPPDRSEPAELLRAADEGVLCRTAQGARRRDVGHDALGLGGREPFEAPARGLQQPVARRRLAGEAPRLVEVSALLRLGGELVERERGPLGVLAAQLVHPVVVHARQQLPLAHGQRLLRAAGRQQRGERPHVDGDVAVELDGRARGHQVLSLGAERPAQLGQGRPQARAGALI
jgi:hypothetical protein